MYTNRFFACLMIVLLGTPVGYAQQTLTVKGVIRGLKNQKVYLEQYGAKSVVTKVDSTVSQDSVFTFIRTIQEPGFFLLTVEGATGGVLWVWDADVQIKGDYQSLGAAKVQGSRLTEEWQSYDNRFILPLRKEIYALSESIQKASRDSLRQAGLAERQTQILAKMDADAEAYMVQHPASFISLFLLDNNATKYGPEKTARILNAFSPALQNHSLAKAIRSEQASVASVNPGKPAPAFVASDLQGNRVSLSALKGRYVLLDFWGTWCGPCLKLIPETKNAHQQYKPKGVAFISVAYDAEKDLEKLKKMVATHQMTWTQVFQNKADDSPGSLINQFKVTAYPSIVLIDPKGTIVFRGTGQAGLVEARKILDKALL